MQGPNDPPLTGGDKHREREHEPDYGQSCRRERENGEGDPIRRRREPDQTGQDRPRSAKPGQDIGKPIHRVADPRVSPPKAGLDPHQRHDAVGNDVKRDRHDAKLH